MDDASTARGVLVGGWADPHPRSTARAHAEFALALPDGRRVPLDVSRVESAAAQLLGRDVLVSGRTDLGPVSGMRVDTLEFDADATRRTTRGTRAATQATTGTRKVLYLLVKYADDTQVPRAPSFYTDLNNPDVPPADSPLIATVNGYFHKVSYGKLSWTGHVGGKGGVPATGWLTLPKPKSAYADCGWDLSCAQIGPLFDDAMAAAVSSGIAVSGYDNINIVLANDMDCCAWGGGQVYGGKYFGVTWEPPWGQNVTTYVHEMGHSLGLSHSGWAYFAYDSPWDVMSSSPSARSVSCGSYYSRNSSGNATLTCTEPGAGYIAPYADRLAWLPAANVVQVNAGDSRTVQLEALSEPLATGVKMIRICLPGEACTGTSAHYLTVEARVKGSGFDKGLTGEGVVIHDFRANRKPVGAGDTCYFNTISGWAMPIDATPGDWSGEPACSGGGRTYPNYALYNAQWQSGQSYVNEAHYLRIAVGARSGASWTVTLGGPQAVPGKPTNVRAIPDDRRVKLTWSAVPGATKYQVLMATTTELLTSKPSRITVTTTSATIDGLVNGQKYYFQVQAFNAYGHSVRSARIASTPMRFASVTAIDQSSLAGLIGTRKNWQVSVPKNARNFRLQIGGGTGDADLYVRYDAQPIVHEATNDAFNCVPHVTGNTEACQFGAPAAGPWYVMLHALRSYSNVRLLATYEAPVP